MSPQQEKFQMFQTLSRRKFEQAAASALLGVGLLAGLPLQASAQIQLPLATWGGEKHVINTGFVPALEKALAETAPGKFKLQEFPNGTLATDKDMPVAIPTGKVKFGLLTVGGWSGTVKDVKILEAPTGLTMDQLDDVLHKRGLLELMQANFAEKQAVLLGVADLGPPALVSKKKIATPADFKGLKVRVFSEGQAETIKAFGGIPVQLGFSELYTALQHGAVDAGLVGFQGVDSGKLYEVASFALLPASFFGTTLMGWAANPQWLRSMPPAERKSLEQAVRRAAAEDRTAILKEIDSLKQHYKSKGMTVATLEPATAEFKQWTVATEPIAQKAKAAISPKAVSVIFSR
jgi:TRAP-type C4-dicarboxylate transport system substrate-binding protein